MYPFSIALTALVRRSHEAIHMCLGLPVGIPFVHLLQRGLHRVDRPVAGEEETISPRGGRAARSFRPESTFSGFHSLGIAGNDLEVALVLNLLELVRAVIALMSASEPCTSMQTPFTFCAARNLDEFPRRRRELDRRCRRRYEAVWLSAA